MSTGKLNKQQMRSQTKAVRGATHHHQSPDTSVGVAVYHHQSSDRQRFGTIHVSAPTTTQPIPAIQKIGFVKIFTISGRVYIWRMPKEAYNPAFLAPTVKYGDRSVMIWAAISWYSPGPIKLL
jgi:hypothetical protein